MIVDEVEYNRLKDSINIQVFKINSNVQGIHRLAEKIGTSQDKMGLQTSLYVCSSKSCIRLLTTYPVQGQISLRALVI